MQDNGLRIRKLVLKLSIQPRNPIRKKGGRARQGCLVAPQYRGGGRVFGPKPKFDQHVKINQKERKAAIRCLLAEKFKENRVWVIDNTDMEAPKPNQLYSFL